MADKYFMLTATFQKEGKSFVYADIFDDLAKLKVSFKKIKPKIPNLQTWLLTPTTAKEDLIITKLEGRWVACLQPKKKLTDKKYIKVKKQEIKLKV